LSIESAFDKSKATIELKQPQYLTTKNGGIVKFQALSPLCLTTMEECPKTAKVIFRDGDRETVCVGFVTQIDKYVSKYAKQAYVPKSSTKPVTKALNRPRQIHLPFPRTRTTDQIWDEGTKFKLDWWEETQTIGKLPTKLEI